MPPLRSTVFLTGLLLFSAPAVQAQSPAQRASLDSLLAGRIDKVVVPAASSAPARTMASLQRGIAELKLAKQDDGRAHLDAAQVAFDEAIFRAPDDWPWPWYGLAMTFVELDHRQMPVKESVHQSAGTSHLDAALRSLSRSLGADPAFRPAATMLTTLAPSVAGEELDPAVVDALRNAAAVEGQQGALLALAKIPMPDRLRDSTLAMLDAYLQRGGDSARGLLLSARYLEELGRPREAVAAYFRGSDAITDSAGRGAYRADLAWVAGPDELEQFDALSSDSVLPWLSRFWQIRDARELRAPGARLVEHLRRLNYVYQHFRLTNRLRGLSFRVNEPDAIMEEIEEADLPLEIRLHSSAVLATPMRDRQGLDDRGLIYMRHGKPDRIAFLGGYLGWEYRTTAGRRVFLFSGSRRLGTQAPTTLLTHLPLSEDLLEAMIALDIRYEILAGQLRALKAEQARNARIAKAGGAPPRPTLNPISMALDSKVTDDRTAELAKGLSTDGFPAEFDHQLAPEAQFYALGTGTGHVLAVFALPGGQLTGIPLDGGAMGYPVTLRLIATNASGDVVRLDTLRNFRSRQALGEGQFLFGLSHLSLPAGTWDVRLLVTQPDANAGGAIGRLGVTIPEKGALALSDLILGRTGSGLEWRGPNGPIHLSPLDSYNRKGEVEVYYELSGTKADTDYRTEVKLEALYGDAEGDLQLGFDDRATGPVLVSRRTVSLENLEPGQYRLSVTVTEQPSGRTATQTRLLNVAE